MYNALPGWRNWQTRQVEGLVGFIPRAGLSPVPGSTFRRMRISGVIVMAVKDNSGHLFSDLARIEQGLVDTVQAAAREVQHTECLDNEQRAEVYSILHALRNDTEAHRQIVGQWVNDSTGEVSDV